MAFGARARSRAMNMMPDIADMPETGVVPIIEARKLRIHYEKRGGLFSSRRSRGREIRAVHDVDLVVAPGEIVALIGESGCGKSTLGRSILHLTAVTDGRIYFEGREITNLTGPELKAFRRRAQMIFQDPFASLNPRLTVRDIVAEPLIVHGLGDREAQRRAVIEALRKVKLTPAEAFLDSAPQELSGGQRQRVAIARAIVLEPRLLVADEPVSMLDVSVRAGVLEILRDMAERDGVGVLYISHDLSTVRQIADRVAVMYLGRIVEWGDAGQVLADPQHPYTKALMGAVPLADPGKRRPRVNLEGEPTNSADMLAEGCAFRARCAQRFSPCSQSTPGLIDTGSGHLVACHHSTPGI